MHHFSNLFNGEMYKDDGNMLKKSQQIPMHTFQEIGPHVIQQFSIFLEIHASVAQECLWGNA